MRRPEPGRAIAVGLLAVLAACLLAAGGLVLVAPAGADPGLVAEPTASATASPTASATASTTASATATPTVTSSATASPTASPTAEPDSFRVEDAVLRWGINDESNNRAFAPRTFNFFSAGRIPDPGMGGVTISREVWRRSAGHVSIEKFDGTSWQPATWAGLSTDSAGVELGAPTDGTFSNHTIVIDGGVGTVDQESGTARIEWDGDVTVLYYSGMSFFYLSDPVLEVSAGVGRLTARLGGFASSQADPTSWAPVPARRVTVADLPAIDLGDARGLVAEPAYAGVEVSGVPQSTGPSAGSFPASFVRYMDLLGTAAFWYSSGASTDAFKVPLPLSVSYDAAVDLPTPSPTAQPSPSPVATPTLLMPPPVRAVPQLVAAPAPASPPAPAPAAPTVPDTVALAGPATEVRLLAAPAVPAPTAAVPASWPWWTGSALLLAAAVLLLVPPRKVAP